MLSTCSNLCKSNPRQKLRAKTTRTLIDNYYWQYTGKYVLCQGNTRREFLHWQQAKKQECMGQDRFKQGSSASKGTRAARRGERLKEYSPPIVRSPALKAAEEQERLEQSVKAPRRAASRLRRTGETTPRRRASTGRVSYAAEGEEETRRGLPRKSLPRKSLQPPGSRRGAVNVYARVEQHAQLVENWPSRPPRSRTADLPGEPVEVISEEEQK